MTASTPWRPASPCHSSCADALGMRSQARTASTSSHEPGKRMTPKRTSGGGFEDLVILDQRVREQLLAHRRELAGVLDVELDEAADVDVGDALEAQRRQRPLDGHALRVEDPGLRPHEDARVHRHGATRASQASKDWPVIFSYASM